MPVTKLPGLAKTPPAGGEIDVGGLAPGLDTKKQYLARNSGGGPLRDPLPEPTPDKPNEDG